MPIVDVNTNVTNDINNAVTFVAEAGGFIKINSKNTKSINLLVVSAIYRGRVCKPIAGGFILQDAKIHDAGDAGFFLNHIAFHFN